jgi:DNA-directed RNA polymerase specialized sigma24 family protein
MARTAAERDALLRAVSARRSAAASERDVRLAAEILLRPLPPRMRAVVEARAANPGATWPEVAETLGISRDAACSLWRRALKRRPA